MSTSEYSNEKLLELVNISLQRWKWAEEMVETQEDTVYIRDKNRVRAQALRDIYVELLSEARRRDLSLTDEQLIDRIIHSD